MVIFKQKLVKVKLVMISLTNILNIVILKRRRVEGHVPGNKGECWFRMQSENILVPKRKVLTGKGGKNKKIVMKYLEKQKTL